MGREKNRLRVERQQTRIVATMGPACAEERVLRAMVEAGMGVARLNFSHGDHESHRTTIALIRKVAHQLGRPVALLQDLCGPKIRLSRAQKTLVLGAGDRVDLGVGNPEDTLLHSDYTLLVELAAPGDTILIDDGSIELEVLDREASRLVCRVLVGGTVQSGKGINLPDARLEVPVFTAKDEADLRFGLTEGVDFAALSFVASPQDAEPLRRLMAEVGQHIPLIAKIERPVAVERMDAILEAFDGLMVARGDLGVETSPERVPLLQKELLLKAAQAGKLTITATQMLESMIHHPRPTRAEVSDVANAILDGTDAIMLSGETAVGRYPVESVDMMRRIAWDTENSPLHRLLPGHPPQSGQAAEAIVRAAVRIAGDIQARCIMVFSYSGSTALKISKFRPPCPVYAFSSQPRAVSRMAAYWGVTPMVIPESRHTDEMVEQGEEVLGALRAVQGGDRVVIVSGQNALKGATNMLKIWQVAGD